MAEPPRLRAVEPTLAFAPELLLAARGPGDGIRAAFFDVDGVLTDGRIHVGAEGAVHKAFSTLDGHGLKRLARAGIEPVVVSGRDSPALRRRLADLGIVHAVCGVGDKLAAIIPAIKRIGVTLVAMTGRADSSLAEHADIVLSSEVEQEACPLNLAPTASTTAQMALGDALAVALLDARGFREEDFARSHPGGALGRKLLIHVRDLMRSGDAVPWVRPGTSFTDMLKEMTGKGLGFTAVADPDGRVLGIFTDGDLRRLIEKGGDLRTLTAGEVMHTGPKLVRADALAVEAAEVMEQHRITSVIVVDGTGALCGALNSNDLMRAKVI